MDDLVIHTVNPGLALLNQLRLKTAVPVAGDGNRQRSIIALQRLARRAIAAVTLLICGLGIRLIAQMIRQFSAQHPFHQADLKFLHQALIAQQIIRVLNAVKQLV